VPKSVVAKPEEIWSYVTRTLTRFTGTPRSDLVGADEPIYTRLDKKITDHETAISDKIASHDSDIKNRLGDPTVDATTLYDFVKSYLDAKISSRSSHTPADVWSYSRRETNVTYLVSRAIGTPEIIYRGRVEFIADKTRVKGALNGSGYGALVDEDEDLIPGATETILETNFDPANLKDHNDDTYTTPAADMGAGEVRDHVKYDLGSSARRAVILKAYSAADTTIVRVLVSDDDATYTKVIEFSGATKTVAAIASFRYIKLQSENTGTGTASATAWEFYTLEVYPAQALPFTKTITKTTHVKKLVSFVYDKSATVAYALWREDDFP